jgi:hypothetical protein
MVAAPSLASKIGVILGAIFIAGLVGFWSIANQPLWALPGFFVAQMPIVSGYSDAMSSTGPPLDWILVWN